MSVIREDVVQIGFDVQDNPMQELINSIKEMKRAITGATDDGEDGLQDMANNIQEANREMRELTQQARRAGNTNVNGLRDSVNQTDRETRQMNVSLTSLIRKAASLSKMKLTRAFQQLKAVPRTIFNKITGGLHKMKNGFAAIKNMSFRKLMSNLNQLAGKGLIKGWQGAKKLGSGLKNAAKVSFNGLKGQISALIPKMKQLAIATAKALGKGAMKGVGALGKGIVSIGKKAVKATKMASLGIAGASVAAFKVGMDFDTSMSQVAATMGMSVDGIHDKTSQQYKDFEMLNKAAREQGKNTKFSAAQAGDALNYLALAGYDANKAVKALPTVLNLATAGGMELAEASDMITDSMSALEIDATQKNLTNFGDQMAKAAQKSNTSVKQLGAAILAVGGDAKGLNGATKDLKNAEMNTALGILADSGIKGAEGGTKLRNIIKSLTPMKKQAIAAFDELGVKAYDTATGKMRPLEDTFTDITKAMSGMTDEKKTKMLNTMFNATDKKAVSAMMAATATNAEQLGTSFAAADIPVKKLGLNLKDMIKNFDVTQSQASYTKKAMKEFGIDAEQAGVMYEGFLSTTSKDGNNRWQDLKTKILDSDGAMQDMSDTMNDNLLGRLRGLGSATAEVGLAFTRNLMEPAKDTVKEITGWMADLGTSIDTGGFDGFVKGIGVFTQKIVHLLADSAPQGMDAVMKIMSSLLGAFEANKSRIATSGVKVLTAFVSGMADMIPRVIVLGAKILAEFLTGVVENMPKMMQEGQNGIQQLMNGIMNELPTILQAGFQILMMLIQGLVEATPMLISGAVYLINGLLQGIQQNLPQIVNSAIFIIMSLIQGIVQVLPNLITVGLQLIFYLAEAIIQNLPAIAQAGFEIILALIKGLAEALPMLGKVLWDAIVGLVKLIFTTDWIDVGKKLIGSIKDGFVDGVKSFFGKGKEAAEETKSGVESGWSDFKLEMPQYDTSSMFSNGYSGGQSYGYGINMGLDETKINSPNLDVLNCYPIGKQGGKQITQGMQDELAKYKPDVSKTTPIAKLEIPPMQTNGITNSMNQVTTASNQMQSNVISSVQTVNQATSELSNNTGFEDVSSSAKKGITEMNTQATQGMSKLKSTFTQGLTSIVLQTRSKMTAIRSIVAATNLYTSGQNVINGLINGMNSKKGQLIATAKAMGNEIKKATNTALDIHSPSRVMKKTGANVVLGTKVGMEDTFGELRKTSKSMGQAVKKETNKEVAPQSQYGLGNASSVHTNNSSSSFVYSPTIPITVNGSVDKQSEFKLRKMMKEILKEDKEQMKRLHPRLREV